MSQELKDAVKAWEEASHANASLGAADTEPDGVFQWCLRQTLQGKEVEVPKSASAWQLYTGMAGSAKAARELTKHLKRCIRIINKTPHGQFNEVREYLESYIWRC